MAFYLLADPIPPFEVVLVFVALLLSWSLVAAWSYVPRLMRATAVSLVLAAMLTLPDFRFCCTCWLCWI
jgi:hypothetical protein